MPRTVPSRPSAVRTRPRGYRTGMSSLHVGLVADPAKPTEVAEGMTDDGQPWELEVVSEPFTLACEDVGTVLARLGEHAEDHEHRAGDEQDLVPAALVRDERHAVSVRGRSCEPTLVSG